MTQHNSQGIGVSGLLLVAFIVLKLTKFIAWPWIWVLAPAWLPPAVGLGVFAVVAVGYLLFVGAAYLFAGSVGSRD